MGGSAAGVVVQGGADRGSGVTLFIFGHFSFKVTTADTRLSYLSEVS